MKKQEYKERYEKAKAERKKRRKKVRIQKITILGTALLTACLIAVGGNRIGAAMEEKRLLEARNHSFVGAPPFDVELLDINEYSRPGIPLEEIKGIVIHYTANPGSTAQNNRDYFEGLKDSHETKVSSHFVVAGPPPPWRRPLRRRSWPPGRASAWQCAWAPAHPGPG